LLIQWDQRGFCDKVAGGRLVAVNTVLLGAKRRRTVSKNT
jgi:hypothetical protein